MKKSAFIPLVTALLTCSSYSFATPFYVGVGLTNNTSDQDNLYKPAGGYQIYGGYDLGIKIANLVNLKVEGGLHDSGDYEGKPQIVNNNLVTSATYSTSGLWAAAVFDYTILNRIGIHATAGLDMGDDDGLLFGGGLSYKFSHKITMNGDYIYRGDSESAQFNVSYKF